MRIKVHEPFGISKRFSIEEFERVSQLEDIEKMRVLCGQRKGVYSWAWCSTGELPARAEGVSEGQ